MGEKCTKLPPKTSTASSAKYRVIRIFSVTSRRSVTANVQRFNPLKLRLFSPDNLLPTSFVMGIFSSKEGMFDYAAHLSQLTEDDIKQMHKRFAEKFETDRWSKEDFLSFFEDTPAPKNFLIRVFKHFDKDRSGNVDFREYMMALHKISMRTDAEKFAWFFEMCDTSGNGTLDKREWLEVFQELDGNQGICVIFSSMDRNKDEQLNEAEFVRGCQTNGGIRRVVFELIAVLQYTAISKLQKKHN